MAKAISSEHRAIDALSAMIGDPTSKVLHGSKTVPGIFKGASAGEKAAAKICTDQRWLEPTGEIAGKGKSRKELYRLTAAGVQAILAQSDSSELLRRLQDSLQQLGTKTQDIPRAVEEKIKEALAPIASLPGVLQSLQATITQALAKIKLPDLDELTRKLSQASAGPHQEHSTSQPIPSPVVAERDWSEEVVRMVNEQKLQHSLQWLTLPQVYERLRANHPQLTLGRYHDGLRRLQDEKKIRLGPFTQALATLNEPRNALYLDHEVKYYVEVCMEQK